MAKSHRIIKGLAAVTLLVTVISGVATAAVFNAVGNIGVKDITDQLGDNRPTQPARPEDGAPINIVLLGSDTRDGQGSGFGGSDYLGSQRSDTTILVHVAGNRDWATAVSIPRDTWITQPDCTRDDGTVSKGYTTKFNEAMQRGGPACVIKTIEQTTGIFIDHYMVLDFKGFQKVVDALGGVEVCLTDAVSDEKSKLELPKGISTLDGKTALAFVRARKTLGDGSDISRIRRQQDFLASVVRKATSAGVLLNPVKIMGLVNAVTESLTTDPKLGSVEGLKDMAFNLSDLSPSTIRFVTAPNTPDPANRNNVIFTSVADELWQSLREDKQWPTPPDNGWDGKPLTAEPSDIRMQVLNGTKQAGLASNKAELLSALGYKVVGTNNTTDFFGKKTAVYATKQRANDARTVAKALGLGEVKIFKKQFADQPSLVVVVGKDFKDPRELKIKVKPKGTLYGPTEGRAADETDCSPA
jgi:LCP family protein required for cell wall assembly